MNPSPEQPSTPSAGSFDGVVPEAGRPTPEPNETEPAKRKGAWSDEVAVDGIVDRNSADAAVNSALAGAAREAVQSRAVRSMVDAAVREQTMGITGLTSPAVQRAIESALADAVKEALSGSGMRLAVDAAVREQITGIAGLTSPAVRRAVDMALSDAVKEAMVGSRMRSAVDAAVREQTTGFAGLTSPAVRRAVDIALTNAAQEAVLGPGARSAINSAVRDRAYGNAGSSRDPALQLELERQAPSQTTLAPDDEEDLLAPDSTVLRTEGSYSADFLGPSSFFAAHEVVIDSFSALTAEIGALAAKHPALTFVWRGQQNADWGLHSSLYRRLMDFGGVRVPASGNSVDGDQVFPDEATMLDAELTVLDEAADWRMSDVTALELFARLQHQGGPTRLLDVTRNPLIAAWFAVEAGSEDDNDARIFALATTPALQTARSEPGDPMLGEVLASKRYPFWTYYSTQERTQADWGTGSRRRIWIPPAYDARIASQNAAFLVEGVPMFTRDKLRLFKDSEGGQWNMADIAASMSVYARPLNPHRRVRATKANIAPLFTFRVEARAKEEIRALLTTGYGYNTALVYPDIQGLSNRLRQGSDWLGRRVESG